MKPLEAPVDPILDSNHVTPGSVQFESGTGIGTGREWETRTGSGSEFREAPLFRRMPRYDMKEFIFCPRGRSCGQKLVYRYRCRHWTPIAVCKLYLRLSRRTVPGHPEPTVADNPDCLLSGRPLAIREQMVTAAHGHLQSQKSHECFAGLLGGNRISNGEEIG
ncbi:hypothetical protein EVAR_11277_1 [Eumeta japonica]|uniref:Uncharacterized protein n=1 Tax=Eumeta variegata TaxID=151549 RepID=A0A4C1UKQ8_EUMVA|nr:hypothetical protein EVAR_11277_1 [Eumeta japonica]